MTDGSYTATLARHLAGAASSALPDDVVARACDHVLDTVAATVSGSRLPGGVRGAAHVASHPEGGSTVVGSGRSARAESAALANGMAAHADETDDSHPASLSHPGCGVVPAALAVAEDRARTGSDLVRAVVAGYDVGTRVVLALGRPPVMTDESSYSTHAYAAQFGAAAAATVLLGLGETAARHALSYTAQSASGVTTWLRDPSHVEKAFVFGGMPAANGVRAVELVASGCDGVDDVFDGHPDFLHAVSSRAEPGRLVDGLGSRHEILHTTVKKYAVGSPAQAAVQAALDLTAQDPPIPDEIAAIEVVLPGDLARIVDRRSMPAVNVQYLVATSLIDRRFSFAAAHDDQRVADPEVRALMDRTTLVADPAVATVRTATVTVITHDGRTRRRHVDSVRGTTTDPMGREEIVEKALDLMGPVLGGERARRVAEVTAALPGVADVRTLGELLR